MNNQSSFASQALLFLMLLAVALGPALINGYPLYFPDSAQYDGHLLRGFERSATPALVSAPLYPLLGAWSLIVVNAIIFAFLITRYTNTFLSSVSPLTTGLLVCATLSPFYTSFLMPDIWIVFLFISVLLLCDRFSWSVFVVAVVACSGHGSHAPILGAAALASFLLGFMSLKMINRVAVIILTSIIVTLAIDNVVVRSTRISTAVVASKIMNDVPQAFSSYCQTEPAAAICTIRDKIQTIRPDGTSDDQYLWASGIWRGGVVSLREFNALGIKLWWIAITNYPLTYLRATIADYWRLVYPSQCIGYGGFVAENAWWIRHLNQSDQNTLARRGFFMSAPFCAGVYWIVVVLSLIGSTALIRLVPAADSIVRSHAFILASAIIMNGAFFALTSGSYARYHLRIFPLVGVIIMLYLTIKRDQKAVTDTLSVFGLIHAIKVRGRALTTRA